MDDEKREDALEYASVSLLEYVCNKFHCFLMQVSLGAAAKERSKPKPKARIHSSLHRFFIEVHRPIRPCRRSSCAQRSRRAHHRQGSPALRQPCNPAHNMNNSAI